MLRSDKGFRDHHFSTCVFHALQNDVEITSTIEIDQCALLRRGVTSAEANGTTYTTNLLFVKKETHADGAHHRVRHLVVINAGVKFFRAFKIQSRVLQTM